MTEGEMAEWDKAIAQMRAPHQPDTAHIEITDFVRGTAAYYNISIQEAAEMIERYLASRDD